MQTIGQLFKSIRTKKNLTLEQVSQVTNIAPHLLGYLEEDQFSKLPSSTFTKGFIVNYAKVLKFPSAKALAVFRRDFTITESGKIMPKGLAKPLDTPTVITSKLIWFGIIAFFLTLFVIYFLFQLRGYHAPPTIEIVRPNIHAYVKGPIITVNGYVSGDSSVYVNDELAQVFPTGEFRATIQLPAGNHEIIVKAVNVQNKTTEQRIPVTVVDK